MTGSKKVLFTPLAFDPGTDWAYGIGIDWLGQVVEVVSGQAIDKYLEDNISGPLEMTRTTFAPSQAERASLVTVHARGADGTITPIDFDWVTNPNPRAGVHSQMTENRIGDLDMQVMKTADPRQSCDAEFWRCTPALRRLGGRRTLLLCRSFRGDGRGSPPLEWREAAAQLVDAGEVVETAWRPLYVPPIGQRPGKRQTTSSPPPRRHGQLPLARIPRPDRPGPRAAGARPRRPRHRRLSSRARPQLGRRRRQALPHDLSRPTPNGWAGGRLTT